MVFNLMRQGFKNAENSLAKKKYYCLITEGTRIRKINILGENNSLFIQ
jgi:hypothetical protein